MFKKKLFKTIAVPIFFHFITLTFLTLIVIKKGNKEEEIHRIHKEKKIIEKTIEAINDNNNKSKSEIIKLLELKNIKYVDKDSIINTKNFDLFFRNDSLVNIQTK